MNNENIIPVNDKIPVLPTKESETQQLAIVSFKQNDSGNFSFEYECDSDIHIQMDETEDKYDRSDFIDAEFDVSVNEADKQYYLAAAASGLLTGAVSMLHLSEEKITAIKDWENKKWKPFIIQVANCAGYKKHDFKEAYEYLLHRAIHTAKLDGKAYAVLSEHPTFAGLVFSILSQFTGKSYALYENGEIKSHPLPKYYAIGNTNAEKLVIAVFYWIFALATKEIENKRKLMDDIGIPKWLWKFISEFLDLPFMKFTTENHSDTEKKYSEWLRSAIIGADISDSRNENEQGNSWRKILGYAFDLAEDAFPVLINECIVYSSYTVIQLIDMASQKQISSLEELSKIPPSMYLPVDNRVFSRMCLIASSTFIGANMTGAVLKAIKEKKVNGRRFFDTLLTEINIAGIGRFGIALSRDSKYWGYDLHAVFRRPAKTQKAGSSEWNVDFEDNKAFDPLILNAQQARLLYCLESFYIRYDIENTPKKEIAEKKSEWYALWKRYILSHVVEDHEVSEQYLVDDEDYIYKVIFALSENKGNWRRFYLLTMELTLFKPYVPFGTANDKSFKKLKCDSDYVLDQFVRRQTIVTQDEVVGIRKTYKKYVGTINGSTQKKIIGAGYAVALAAAGGGLAFAFAPGIAVAIAGEAVAGLHGAALANAGLAFVGGGALAAGGLGVAGGTAIIAGGGALLGLVGSGSVSTAVILLQTSRDYLLCHCAKLLTYCKCVLCDKFKDFASVKKILAQVQNAIAKLEPDIAELKNEKNDLDKELIEKMSEYTKYLKRTASELQKML